MPTKKIVKTKKKVAAPPSAIRKAEAGKKKPVNPLFEKRIRNFGIGNLFIVDIVNGEYNTRNKMSVVKA